MTGFGQYPEYLTLTNEQFNNGFKDVKRQESLVNLSCSECSSSFRHHLQTLSQQLN